MSHYMLGQEEQAGAALTKAVEAGVDFPELEEARARLVLLAIDPRTAGAQDRADLEEFLKARPRDPAALARLAALRVRDGNPDQAIKIYDNILVDDPLYAPAVRQLALIYAERAPDAARTYDVASQAREAYPGDAEIAKMLGILSYRRGFYPRALELLSDASAKLKNDAELLYYLGAADYEARHLEDCKTALERAVRLSLPDDLADNANRILAACAENAQQKLE